jgi:hypothetical protein
MSADDSTRRAIGWNWLWLAPLSATALLFVEMHTIPLALRLGKLALQRWSWGALISPSAYFCLGVILASVYLPFHVLLLMPAVFTSNEGDATRRRYFLALFVAVVVFLLPFLTDALIWGSFPFNIDNNGVARLRLIPFFPWPDGNFGEY